MGAPQAFNGEDSILASSPPFPAVFIARIGFDVDGRKRPPGSPFALEGALSTSQTLLRTPLLRVHRAPFCEAEWSN
jgi:hypothetical protein